VPAEQGVAQGVFPLRSVSISRPLFLIAALGIAGCGKQTGALHTAQETKSQSAPKVTRIDAGPQAQKLAQTALIKANPGEIIEFGPGKFEFLATLSLDVDSVTIRGQGPDETILSFRNQGQGTGGEGILVTSKKGVTLENFAIEDAKGDAIKLQGTRGLFIRKVRAEWTGGPKETNGGYGLYPVQCADVVIEECTVQGASDAGVYVGQSENIIVRRNRVEQNVAGIEIENCTRADVYDNEATNNAGGILIFTMPDLPKKDGRHCRVFKNKVIANNHTNFAPKGNIVAMVPPGTGIMVMAADMVEFFDNTIEKNQTTGLSIVSYLLTGKSLSDDKYDPYCEAISIHDNRFAGNGEQPRGAIALLASTVLGSPLPDILYDGSVDPAKTVNGELPENLAIRIRDNGNARFANFNAGSPDLGSAPAIDQSSNATGIARSLKPYDGKLSPLAPVSIEGVQ
jgi:parallel beta-helix repeat protein